MLRLAFFEKLKKLNPRLFVIGDDNDPNRPWGIYLRDKDGMRPPEHMCGINPDGLGIDEFTHRRWDGYVLHQGWRRILKMLIDRRAIDVRKAEKVFRTNLRKRYSKVIVEQDPLTKAMHEAKRRGFNKTGDADYVEIDDMIDIHRWREQLRKDPSNYWA